MSFRITGLSAEPFRRLSGLSDEALAAHGAQRYVADQSPGFPDRVSLTDLAPGEPVQVLVPEAAVRAIPITSPGAAEEVASITEPAVVPERFRTAPTAIVPSEGTLSMMP